LEDFTVLEFKKNKSVFYYVFFFLFAEAKRTEESMGSTGTKWRKREPWTRHAASQEKKEKIHKNLF
jgi:hypothetical protein